VQTYAKATHIPELHFRELHQPLFHCDLNPLSFDLYTVRLNCHSYAIMLLINIYGIE